MAPKTTLLIYDEVHDGALVKSLRDWRADGLSVTEIVKRLDSDYSISTGERTVYRWLEQAERAAS